MWRCDKRIIREVPFKCSVESNEHRHVHSFPSHLVCLHYDHCSKWTYDLMCHERGKMKWIKNCSIKIRGKRWIALRGKEHHNTHTHWISIWNEKVHRIGSTMAKWNDEKRKIGSNEKKNCIKYQDLQHAHIVSMLM